MGITLLYGQGYIRPELTKMCCSYRRFSLQMSV